MHHPTPRWDPPAAPTLPPPPQPSPLAGLPTAALTVPTDHTSDYQLLVYSAIQECYERALAAENAAWEALPHEQDRPYPPGAQGAWERACGFTEGIAAVRQAIYQREVTWCGKKEGAA